MTSMAMWLVLQQQFLYSHNCIGYKLRVSLTLREEHGLRVFENRVLRRIFAPKRDEVTGGWRKLYNEELPNLHSSQSTW
jgi:hypothetical protein